MNQPIKWQRNQFVKLYARMKIRLGGKTDVTIEAGDEFETDGTIVKYAGFELPLPGIRGSYNDGWCTTDPGEVGNGPVRAVVPTRNVARSDMKTTDLSRVQRSGSQAFATDALDEETVLHVSDRTSRENYDERGRLQRHITAADNRRQAAPGQRMAISQSDMDSQDGVVIGRVGTKAKLGVVDVDKRPEIAGRLNDLSTEHGAGRAHLIEREGITVRTNLGRTNRTVSESHDEGVVVGQVRNSSTRSSVDGISVRDTSSIRNKRPAEPAPAVRPARTAAKPAAKPAAKKVAKKVAAKPAAPVKKPAKPIPKAAAKKASQKAAPKIVSKPAKENLSPQVRIARQFDPSFPSDWVFTGRLSDRLAAIKEHGASDDFVRAVYAAEGDQMRKVLVKEFAGVL